MFRNRREACAIIGSSNITSGGTFGNKEANVAISGSTSYGALKGAIKFFEDLWDGRNKPEVRTKAKLDAYKSNKTDFQNQTSGIKKPKKHLPKGKLVGVPIIATSPEIWINGKRTLIDDVRVICTEPNCGRTFRIPPKWDPLTFVCQVHAGRLTNLRKKRGYKPKIADVAGKLEKVTEIARFCTKRIRRKREVCGIEFFLTPDFTHAICHMHYRERKKKGLPVYKLPETAALRDGKRFCYDVSEDDYWA